MLSDSMIDSVVAAVEPMFVLIGYLAVHNDRIMTEVPNVAGSVVYRCLGALRNEIEMIARAYDALIEFLSLAAMSETPTTIAQHEAST